MGRGQSCVHPSGSSRTRRAHWGKICLGWVLVRRYRVAVVAAEGVKWLRGLDVSVGVLVAVVEVLGVAALRAAS